MWTRVRAVVLGAAALTLAACGSIHPGDAAVVDGQAISMETFDKNARLYCDIELQLAKQGGAESPSLPNNEVRAHAITDLVTIIVARDLAEEKGVTPDKQVYQRPDDELKNIATLFPDGDDAQIVESILENNSEVAAIAVALGEKSSRVARNEENQSELFAEGQAEIQKAFKDHDVKFAPRFGLSSTLKALSSNGSVSVAEVSFDAPTDKELPPAQRCT